MKNISKALILTIGYGHGHISAAEALAQGFLREGVRVRVEDLCAEDKSGVYALSKWYYQLCVRRAPWLWAMSYAQTETANWRSFVNWPIVRRVTFRFRDILLSWRPDIIVCTYPLFAYMADYLRERGECSIPCAVVVTDSLEISKPWIKSQAQYFFVPDEFSYSLLRDRYGIAKDNLFVSGFPVRKQFLKLQEKSVPSLSDLHIVYGVYTGARVARRQLLGILRKFTSARVTVIAGVHFDSLNNFFSGSDFSARLQLLQTTDNMAGLLSAAHIYIGKTGAATMFECYASGVPMIVNFALPGQEQGNLELLLLDRCGYWAGNGEDLSEIIADLISNGAKKWSDMRRNMLARSSRVQGALFVVQKLDDII